MSSKAFYTRLTEAVLRFRSHRSESEVSKPLCALMIVCSACVVDNQREHILAASSTMKPDGEFDSFDISTIRTKASAYDKLPTVERQLSQKSAAQAKLD